MLVRCVFGAVENRYVYRKYDAHRRSEIVKKRRSVCTQKQKQKGIRSATSHPLSFHMSFMSS